jgi:8-oxo-dGTP pyrophosphatase MutT (NUDIX family)
MKMQTFPAGESGATEPAVQVAALCLREGPAGPEVLMVTSRTTRRWVLPKGWPIEGLTDAASALQEAWEEAGVTGTVADQPVGHYRYLKTRRNGQALACRVAVYPVQVAALAGAWPEAATRQRAWLPLAAAAAAVDEDELRALLTGLRA